LPKKQSLVTLLVALCLFVAQYCGWQLLRTPAPPGESLLPTQVSFSISWHACLSSSRAKCNPSQSGGKSMKLLAGPSRLAWSAWCNFCPARSEEHTSELQSRSDLVCRLLLEKKKKTKDTSIFSFFFSFIYLFLFFLILPPPPISTLFPYTTLFRSQVSFSISWHACLSSSRAKCNPSQSGGKSMKLLAGPSRLAWSAWCNFCPAFCFFSWPVTRRIVTTGAS